MSATAYEPKTSSDKSVLGKLYSNGVGLITIERPGALNAANKDMVVAIHNLLTEFSADPACRYVFHTGPSCKCV